MKVLVPVKRVVDYNVKVRVKADGSGVDIANVKMSMNPFDEIATEEAIRLQGGRQGDGGRGRVPGRGQAARRRCAPHWPWAPTGRSWSRPRPSCSPGGGQAAEGDRRPREQPGLVLMGKQAIDDDSNQTPQMLAALLGWPQATFVSKLAARGRQGHGQPRGRRGPGAARGQAAGRDQRRSAAQRAALRVAAQHHEGQEEADGRAQARGSRRRCRRRGCTTCKFEEPPKRQAGAKVGSVAELVAKLKDEAGVL